MNVTLPNIKWGLLYGIILTNAVRCYSMSRALSTVNMPFQMLCFACSVLYVLYALFCMVRMLFLQ